jgi:uncharacterized coiled-coil protein SlyX
LKHAATRIAETAAKSQDTDLARLSKQLRTAQDRVDSAHRKLAAANKRRASDAELKPLIADWEKKSRAANKIEDELESLRNITTAGSSQRTMETAAKLPKWIEDMSPSSKKAYLKAHPETKYAEQIKALLTGDGSKPGTKAPVDKIVVRHQGIIKDANETLRDNRAEIKELQSVIKSLPKSPTAAQKSKVARAQKKIAALTDEIKDLQGVIAKSKAAIEKRSGATSKAPVKKTVRTPVKPAPKAAPSKAPEPKKRTDSHEVTEQDLRDPFATGRGGSDEDYEARKARKERNAKALTAKAKPIMQKLGLPGKLNYRGEFEFDKKGGHAAAKKVSDIMEKAKASGFKVANDFGSDSPDGSVSSSSTILIHPDGWVLDAGTFLGQTSASNGAHARLRYVGPDGAKEEAQKQKAHKVGRWANKVREIETRMSQLQTRIENMEAAYKAALKEANGDPEKIAAAHDKWDRSISWAKGDMVRNAESLEYFRGVHDEHKNAPHALEDSKGSRVESALARAANSRDPRIQKAQLSPNRLRS